MSAARLNDMKAGNAKSAFNKSCGFEVISASGRIAELAVSRREEFWQSSKFLHSGLIAALVDTACGQAAATVAGPVMASHYSVNCIRPGVGQRFVARAKVVRAGRVQVFTACEVSQPLDPTRNS